MLRVVQCASAGAAKRYFVGGGGSPGDYYLREEPGVWGGTGATRLGLGGEVTQETFGRLCDNQRPDGRGPLTGRTNLHRRVGYDFNFHCPKSVSLVHALTGDSSIVSAFRAAVDSTMALIEREMKTRVRSGGEDHDRLTGNMVWATFVHTTSRPIEGIPDPHLHAHCLVMNATWDSFESRWKAGQFGDIKRDAGYFESCFHASLAHNLLLAGYETEQSGKGWEIAGIGRHVIERFSRRTSLIEKVAAEREISDPKKKAALGAQTRRGKGETRSESEVRAHWLGRLTPTELQRITGARQSVKAPSRVPLTEAIEYAIATSFERHSVVSQRTLEMHALRRGRGSVLPHEVPEALERCGLIRKSVNGETIVTTAAVLREEEGMLAFAREGRGSCRAIGAAGAFERPIETRLNAGQLEAVQYLLSSHDRVMLIHGKAGTGKTTMMREAVGQMEARGAPVSVFAPSSEATAVLRREGFDGAQTVARLLADRSSQERLRNGVLWVDEAGLLGSATLSRVFDIAHEQDARVVLSGDSRQHRSVARGDALRVLQAEGGLGGVSLRDIQRQRGEYRSAIESLAEGRTDEGLWKLDTLGGIREVPKTEAHEEIAKGYLKTVASGRSALIVCPTHAEGSEVTVAVRRELAAAGRIGEDRPVEQLRSLRLTEAQKSDPNEYRPGLVVEFHQNARGFRAGSRYDVVDVVASGTVMLRTSDGDASLPLPHGDRFDVFERGVLPLAPGDMVRITRNGRVPALESTASGFRRLENGSVHEIQAFTRDGDLVLQGNKIVPKDFGHITHGYCMTSHASQGKTVDVVFVAQSSDSFHASSAQQFYVSASRARDRVVVYTDDRIGLREAVRRSDTRVSAVELVRESPRMEMAREDRGRSAQESQRGTNRER